MKKSFKLKVLIPATLVLLGGSYSCKKYLDQAPISALIPSVLATRTGVDGVLIGAYSLVDGVFNGQSGAPWETGTDNWVYGSVVAGDAFKGSNPGDQPAAANLEAFSATGSNDYLDHKWRICYAGVQRANDVLRLIPAVKDGSITPDQIKQYVAEARFLRGFYHLEAAKIWKMVPYVAETVTYSANNYLVPNDKTIWDKIAADFAAAAADLPATQPQIGRANKWAALAFQAKTLMYDHKYPDAFTILKDVITNGKTSSGASYALGKYANNFNPSTKNGPEGVFVVQTAVNDGANGLNGNAGSVLNFPSGGPAGCCGFFQPTFDFVNSFKVDANGLPLIDTYQNNYLKNDQAVSAATVFTPSDELLDARLDWSVGRRGIPYLDWGICPGAAWARDQPNGGPYLPIKNVYYKAAQATTSDAYGGWAANQATSNSYNAIRFADVLLWAAECAVEATQLAVAEGYVNQVRARAADQSGWVKGKLTGYTDGDATKPIVDKEQFAANYKVGLYTGQFAEMGQVYARKAVYFERKIELGMEGHRFFDLSRWDATNGGPAGTFMSTEIEKFLKNTRDFGPTFTSAVMKVAKFTPNKNEQYPIPQFQIDISKGTLKQNKGY
ncbi:RagB/SusD family nutrient uptake outer membrane protein [Mucilaginibacter sp. RB4R14]|uniref:RagB/SusD family nutrient uptake outer membrane protein n=1 Tax=Mucilaginibacter aurantiaciroseus TaxID=2949308 RepID=UPI00209061CA|nr:RagB/SusD family nutrient uptake outer membrane protein [Mucilaginibacter aurantiaciroseus]MCO5936331.1 RagB/SusD family nutrient uptake outer membrane protein [Mucilaginibacter aurantiaciroseus]